MNAVTPSAMTPIDGGVIIPLATEACEQYCSWLLNEPSTITPNDLLAYDWMLAHGDEGVTWSHYDKAAGVWRRGDQAAPAISPPLRQDTLQEVRIFGEFAEILIWRTQESLLGRILQETFPPTKRNDATNPMCPSDESRILRGDEVHTTYEHSFSHLADRTGAEQVIPLRVSAEDLRKRRVRLRVRHYYQTMNDSGAIRVGATRLVALTVENA